MNEITSIDNKLRIVICEKSLNLMKIITFFFKFIIATFKMLPCLTPPLITSHPDLLEQRQFTQLQFRYE